jgi:hypothetical protein
MEKAVYITRLDQLKHVHGGYKRLYFGNEFCERQIPSLGGFREALLHAEKKKLYVTLVTPYVTEFGLKRVESLLDFLGKRGVNCEIVINDWGVLHLVNQKYQNLIPVLGRLLTKQKRCPRAIKLLKRESQLRLFQGSPENPHIRQLVIQRKLPLDVDPYYKGSNASSVPIIHEFLIKYRVQRIELDNVGQGLWLELPLGKIAASIYTPYVYISTTFFCQTAGCEQKRKSLLKIKPCNSPCQRYVFKLRHKTMHKTIFLKGNTQFYKNDSLAMRPLTKMGVDRIVYQPEIPV